MEDKVASNLIESGQTVPANHYLKDWSHARFHEKSKFPHHGDLINTGRHPTLGAIADWMVELYHQRKQDYDAKIDLAANILKSDYDYDDYQPLPNTVGVDAAEVQLFTGGANRTTQPRDALDAVLNLPDHAFDRALRAAVDAEGRFIGFDTQRVATTLLGPNSPAVNQSRFQTPMFLLLGDRGTRKTTLANMAFAEDNYIDLIDEIAYNEETLINAFDEVWKRHETKAKILVMTANPNVS